MEEPPGGAKEAGSPFRSRAARAMASLLLVIISTSLTYIALEFALFRMLLPQLPVDLAPFLPGAASVLMQDSKSEFMPHRYIALLGDSYALGVGDWLLEARSKGTKPFHSAHVIQEATGRDVASFAREGYGSAQALVYEPSRIFPEPPCLVLPTIEPPREMFIYFYEGNDVNDNAGMVAEAGKAFNSEDDNAVAKHLKENVALSPAFWRCHVHLANTIDRMARFVYHHHIRGVTLPSHRPAENALMVAGGTVAAPALQGPALNFPIAGIDRAMPVLTHSLAWLRARFPGIPVTVVYLPAPLSVYRHAGETAVYQLNAEPGVAIPISRVITYSDHIADRVRDIATQQGAGFLDARPALRAAALTKVLHGPRDWYHFNEAGYRVLGDLVVQRLNGAVADGAPVPTR